jgi:hypothetical protein
MAEPERTWHILLVDDETAITEPHTFSGTCQIQSLDSREALRRLRRSDNWRPGILRTPARFGASTKWPKDQPLGQNENGRSSSPPVCQRFSFVLELFHSEKTCPPKS